MLGGDRKRKPGARDGVLGRHNLPRVVVHKILLISGEQDPGVNYGLVTSLGERRRCAR